MWKEYFGPLSNSLVIFLLSPGKMLLTSFLFQKWFGSPFPEDIWAWWLLMHSLQLQSTLLWSSPNCLNQLCFTVFSSLHSSLLLVHLFLPHLFLPVNFAFNMLWYSNLWRATPFSNDPLWLTLFVKGVNDCLLDYCQVSSLPHYCGFKEQEIPGIYTVWMVASLYRRTCHLLLRFLCRKGPCRQREELGSKCSISFPIQRTRDMQVTRNFLF